MRIDDDLYALAMQLGHALSADKAMVATAESCTGGLVAGAITAVAGSSSWFDRGFVTYSNDAKIEQLGVSQETLASYGAVSVQTAAEMAAGARRASNAQWAVAVTGVAGPGGGSIEKPVGLVCFAWAGPAGVVSEQRLLQGDRAAIRRESVRTALAGLIHRLA
jgi:nicotinamide-nucleotide amidase